MTVRAEHTRRALIAGKKAWFSGRVSDDGVPMGDMSPDEWNAYVQAALAELAALERIAEAADEIRQQVGRYIASDGSTASKHVGVGAFQEYDQAVAAFRALRADSDGTEGT